MSSHVWQNLAVAIVMTLAIGLLEGADWSAWLVAAVFAGALALGTWFASAPTVAGWELRPRAYAAGALVALVVGGIAWWVTGGDNGAFWGVGVVAGISTSISAAALRHET